MRKTLFPEMHNADAFSEKIKSLITEASVFSVLFIRLHPPDFSPSKLISATLKLLAQIILQTVQQYGNSDDFIVYLGGFDFAVITTAECADSIGLNIVMDFDTESANQQSMRVTVGVVTNMKRTITYPSQVLRIGKELITYTGQFHGSKFIIDRRFRPPAWKC